MDSRDSDIRILTELCGWQWRAYLNYGYGDLFPPDAPPTNLYKRTDRTDLRLTSLGVTPRLDSVGCESNCFKYIVPAMAERGLRLELQDQIFLDGENPVWCALFNNGQSNYVGEGTSASEAITRAAIAFLNALEVAA